MLRRQAPLSGSCRGLPGEYKPGSPRSAPVLEHWGPTCAVYAMHERVGEPNADASLRNWPYVNLASAAGGVLGLPARIGVCILTGAARGWILARVAHSDAVKGRTGP